MTKISDQHQAKQLKLRSILEHSIDPYPARVARTHTISQVIFGFDQLQGKIITIVGRLRSIRLHGGSCFAHLEDGTDRMQIFLKRDEMKNEDYTFFTDLVDVGDFIEASGSLFTTKKGEKTLLVKKFRLISKSLAPLPEKWHGLSDVEIRYRQRYLDLMVNPEVKAIFNKRGLIIKTIREFLDSEDFLAVETPILQTIPGGALAKPFKTQHHALNTEFYLRVAPELYLKRLIVGGFEKVYEIGRCFRNEGIDRDHNPEFTQVEFYVAYMDYFELMKFTEKLLVYLLSRVNRSLLVTFENNNIDFTPPYARITFHEALKKYAKIDIEKYKERDSLAREVKKIGLTIDKSFGRGRIMDEVYKELVRSKIINPTFITEYPIELSPLAKKLPKNPEYTERFQLVVAGRELVNAFSELNDPIDQKERFEVQEELRKAGDEETQRIDHDFIEALEYGMPPTAGFGMGIDRLVAILTNSHNIKEVILFPTLKPKK